MRGTAARGHRSGLLRRFIPAHAGNSAIPCPASTWPAVHPRACGEQPPMSANWEKPCGSSPRMRGTEQRPAKVCRLARFIPAHAGNSQKSYARCAFCSVHPRACGEQASSPIGTFVSCGSSPRMRGTAGDPADGRGVVRFIPAHAGNRAVSSHASQASAVHPRACGEQLSV